MDQTPVNLFIENEHYKINKNGCWEWLKAKDKDGYGIATLPLQVYGKRTFRAHRLSYIQHNGSINANLYICHHCDNRACINPQHLFMGTQKDNIQDRISKKGHTQRKLSVVDVKNIRKLIKNGVRQCVVCRKYKISHGHLANIINNKIWKPEVYYV